MEFLGRPKGRYGRGDLIVTEADSLITVVEDIAQAKVLSDDVRQSPEPLEVLLPTGSSATAPATSRATKRRGDKER